VKLRIFKTTTILLFGFVNLLTFVMKIVLKLNGVETSFRLIFV